MFFRVSLVLGAASCVAMFSGCGEPRPEFAPVEGVIKVNGKPEPGVTVTFSSDGEQGVAFPTSSRGTTDQQGKYVLTYEFRGEEGPGAAVGLHRVTLFDTKVGYVPQGQVAKPTNIPRKYSDPSTTPLNAEVKPGELQTFNFEVTK